MADLMKDIEDFHRKFELHGPQIPTQLPSDLHEFRVDFMLEELHEYRMAHNQGNIVDQLDALVDLTYVVLGTAYLHGFDFNEAWRRVHAANMAKVRAASEVDSKRGSAYDVVKPEGWTAPDLSDLV